ncbi:MAG TPA: hypothetical protein VFS40_14670 [Gemmatimonadales bacterium]|nr:hypothetical protein [Gemmatimonadales bacterium]
MNTHHRPPDDRTPATTDELYALAWSLHERARAAGRLEVAYHALAAALHAAEDGADNERIEAVGVRARQEQERIDRELPGHWLATAVQAGREVHDGTHHTPLYTMLARTAAAARARAAADSVVRRAEQRRHPPGAPRGAASGG